MPDRTVRGRAILTSLGCVFPAMAIARSSIRSVIVLQCDGERIRTTDEDRHFAAHGPQFVARRYRYECGAWARQVSNPIGVSLSSWPVFSHACIAVSSWAKPVLPVVVFWDDP